MRSYKLNLRECIPAAKIFLNIFGLTLDENNNIKCNDKVVGDLYVVDDTVLMRANYNDATLEASFDIPEANGFVDTESNNALFGEWRFPIKFESNCNNINYKGNMLFACTADSEYGLKCQLHPNIDIQLSENCKINLKMMEDFSFLRLDIEKPDYYETINISPWTFASSFLRHQIIDGKEIRSYVHPYNFQAGVFPGAEVGELKDKLHVFLSEVVNDNEEEKYLSFHNEFLPREGEPESKEALIQKGFLMQKLDKSMYEKIKGLNELMNIGNVSILDNLVSTCYCGFSDEEVIALLGFERQKMNYQDPANNLLEAYFNKDVLANEKIKRFKN